LLDAAPRLRLIVKPGAGVDEIDAAEAARRRITVRHTPGVNAPAVAELTLGLLVALVRRIPEHHDYLRTARRWDRFAGVELYQKTLGVIGVGHVGSRVARLGRAIQMTVIGCDPYIDPTTAAAPLVDCDALLASSDVVSLHVPLTDETRGMIDAGALSRMRPGAYLVNMSRGEVVHEPAVVAALDAGHLAGYAADVLAGEVPGMAIASPLLGHPGVLLTPHLGAWTSDTDRRVCAAVVEAVRGWLAAQTPLRGGLPAPGASAEG
jgi:phosphoglycerate dehydrogenase-like enzyme